MTEPTYYQVLQVDPNASPEIIEAAYRRLAKMYHPDVNKSPDAERRMKQINTAYQVLRDPVTRWQYHGTMRWNNPASSSTTSTSRPTGEVRRQPLRKMAWLKSQHRTKEGYFISIGNATDFDLAIELLKASVAARARSYNPTKKEWWISEDYEDVLEGLFYNFTPHSYGVDTEPTRTTTSYTNTYQQTTTPQSRSLSGKGYTGYGKQSSNSGGWITIALIVGAIVWWTAANNGNSPAAASPTATVVTGNTLRSAAGPIAGPTNAPARTNAPRPTSPPQPTTVREANIREGPSPDFAIARTVTSGTTLDIVGYNDDREVVWYKLSDGTWIWGDLVTNAPDVPYVVAPTLPTSLPTQDCRGGCTTRPTWCEPPIKGNVGFETGERIYHVAGQEFYDATRIDPRYGERWFCTEQEALDAGWRKSYR